ncbi:MAG: hypothetical protein QOH67_4755 [Hyphomicrobiales bacterium]|nr:hypothetical protein [Hyphomicrobiales bacterium]
MRTKALRYHTWPKPKEQRRIKNDKGAQYAFRARAVMRDVYRARQSFFEAETLASSRLSWVTATTLLRAVGHTLKNIDSSRSVFLKDAVDAAFQSWRKHSSAHRIFFKFIVDERNSNLKEFRSVLKVVGDPGARFPEGPEVVLEFEGELVTARQILGDAIRWWEEQVGAIEENAEELRSSRQLARRSKKRK